MMRSLFAVRWPFRAALVITIIVSLIVGVLTFRSHALDGIQRTFFDWRIALLGDKGKGPHDKIVIVRIDEPSVAKSTCRSPVDRKLLADLIHEIDSRGPKVIAIDYFFDQATDPQADAALEAALAAAQARVVLAAYNESFPSTPEQRDQQTNRLMRFGKPKGYANITRDADGWVRAPAPPGKGARYPISFAEQIALAADTKDVHLPERIAWLRPPPSGETFRMVSATELQSNAGLRDVPVPDPNLDYLHNAIVLIGSDLADQRDSYLTPLSTIKSDGYDLMPGVLINAQILAQILDGRKYYPLGQNFAFGLAIIAAFFGALYGWYFEQWRGPTGLPPLLVFFAVDMIAFSVSRIIIPFAIPATAWVLGAWIGQWIDKRKKNETTAIQP